MLISALSAPIYAASLAAVALRRKRGFVTTPKGDASTRDTLITFRKHLLWALVFGVPLAFSFILGHHHFSMRAWSFASLVVCLLPVAVWRVELFRARRAEPVAAPVAAAVAAAVVEPEPVEEPERVLRPVPDLPPEPVREEPLAPVAVERRKHHQVVRFDRRTAIVRDRVANGVLPVREFKRGRRKNHVVVRFDPPQGHQFGQQEPPEWQVYDQAEA